jgi:hypothetical protein
MQVYDIVVKKSKNERINELRMDMDDILSGQHVTGHSTVLNLMPEFSTGNNH